MSLTPAQTMVFIGYVRSWTAHLDRTTKGMTLAISRLERLMEAGFSIEVVLIEAQLVEHNVKLILEGYVCMGRILKLLEGSNPYEYLNLNKIDEYTLGDLIGALRRVGSHQKLIVLLSRLNVLRKEMTHYLFDGNREVEKVEKDAEEFLSEYMNDVLIEIKNVVNTLTKDINNLGDLYQHKTKKE